MLRFILFTVMLKFSELAEKIYKTDCIIIESTHESSILVHNHRKDSMTLLLSQAQPGLGWQFFLGSFSEGA